MCGRLGVEGSGDVGFRLQIGMRGGERKQKRQGERDWGGMDICFSSIYGVRF